MDDKVRLRNQIEVGGHSRKVRLPPVRGMQVDCPVYKALVNDQGFIRPQVGPEKFVLSEHVKIPLKHVPPELNRSGPAHLAQREVARELHVMEQEPNTICAAQVAEKLPQQGAAQGWGSKASEQRPKPCAFSVHAPCAHYGPSGDASFAQAVNDGRKERSFAGSRCANEFDDHFGRVQPRSDQSLKYFPDLAFEFADHFLERAVGIKTEETGTGRHGSEAGSDIS